MSIVSELLSNTLGATRDQVRETLEALESKLASNRMEVSRRVGAALDSDDASRAADDLVVTAQPVQDDDLGRLAGKLVLCAEGLAWGLSVGNAAAMAGAGWVALGSGISASPLIAILLAIVTIAMSGYMGLKILRELFNRLERQIDLLQQAS